MAHSPSASSDRFLTRLLSSLSIPAYRWLWFNSVFGSMRLITVFVTRGWLVLELTNSPFWVGAAPAVRGIVQITLGLFAGVLLDRINRRSALFVSEIGATAVSAVLGVLVFTGQIELWHVIVGAVVEGMAMSVRWPAINTLIVQVVNRDQLLNASAAQMLGFNVGNVVASAVAGLVVATYGIEYGYFFSAVCGVVGAVCILWIVGDFRPKTVEKAEPVFQAIKEGLVYIGQYRALIWLIALGLLMALFGWSNLTMLPVMARDVLGQDASGLGYLTGVGAFGSLLSTAFVASLGDYKDKTRLVLVAGALTTAGIIAFSFSTWFALSLVLAGVMQAALMAFEVTLTATVLLITDDEMQGRVQGIYTQVFGFTWVGGVLLGSIAEYAGAPLAIALGGGAIGVVVLAAWRPLRRMKTQFDLA